jgi:hypothetical protein
MRTYLYARWVQSSANEPYEFFSELDEFRNEIRKVERYRDGSVGYASPTVARHGASLGIVPVPPLAEINASPEFTANEISEAEFEKQWQAAISNANHVSTR